MKKESVKQENVKLKKKVRSLTIENDCLEAELRYLYSSLDDYKEMNDINTKTIFHIKQNKGGHGKKAYQDTIINFIEIMRIFHSYENKKSRRFLSNAIIDYNKRKNIIELKASTVYKFLRKINFANSILYTPEFFKDKTNEQIFSYLDNKFNFNAKV